MGTRRAEIFSSTDLNQGLLITDRATHIVVVQIRSEPVNWRHLSGVVRPRDGG